MHLNLVDTLGATGSTDSLLMRAGFVSLEGTWTGSVAVEVDAMGDGSWTPLTDITSTPHAWTANTTITIDNGAPVKTRVTFTRSSGTLEVGMVGDPG